MGLLTVLKNNKVVDYRKPNLMTWMGLDFIHAQTYVNDDKGTRGANYIALSSHSGSPSEDDKELIGEITTNGLQRKAAGVAHTIGTNMSVIMVTFVAQEEFTAVQKSGVFNNANGGVLLHENTFTPTDLRPLDKLTFIWQTFLG